MVSFSRFRGDVEDDLEDQVARLSREVAGLKKALSRRGSDAYDDARDAASGPYGDMRHRLHDVLPLMGRRAREAERMAHDNPATAALVGLAVIGLVAALLSRK